MSHAQQEYDRVIRPLESTMIQAIWRIVRDANDADDALQDSLTRIWRQWHRVIHHPHPQALILRICINSSVDLLRRRVRLHHRYESNEVLGDLAARGPRVERQLEDRERGSQIRAALTRLSGKQATAVLMRLIEDKSHALIAEALGCSEATARVHYGRGCRRLSEELRHLYDSDEREKRHEPCERSR